MNQLSLLPDDVPKKSLQSPSQIILKIAPITFIDGYYNYYVPSQMIPPPIGALVKVPLAGRYAYGIVYGAAEEEILANKLKPISHYYEEIEPFSPALLHFMVQLAAYNCVPLGQALKLTLPLTPEALLKDGRKRADAATAPPQPKILNEEQLENAEHLCAMHGFQVALLDGATGSGKTEVFFAFAEHHINAGGQVLLLVPEIALSLQLVERATARFGVAPILWHSSQTPARRRDALQAIISGEAKLIIGARSALFLPYNNLSAIIVDEEHEASYKQDDNASYHARDMAVLRAKCEDIPVLLTSATPSLESLANVNSGKYQHLRLSRRDNQAKLPKVHLIDMKREKTPAMRWISPTLQSRLAANLEVKQQSLLFLNRKGYAPLVICKPCGHRYECPSCSAWLVYHAKHKHLHCHHCGLQTPLPQSCPNCGESSDKLAMCGSGVERIEEEVKGLFPLAKIALLSGELSKSPTLLQQTLTQIASGEIDIIIGTQIIAKGHHFPNLSLVGVIDADAGLNGGDVRGSERTYQLLHQIAGRAGREKLQGEVLLQTSQPNHELMLALQNWDREAFISLEMKNRRMTNMPPYGRLAAVIVEGLDENKVQQAALKLSQCAPKIKGVRVLGGSNAPLYKLRNQYRVRFLVIAEKNIALQPIMLSWRTQAALPSQIKCKIDIDPINFY
jgi:primosomal protein N' (replication factor Y) (superfamily II helicase)